MKKSLFLLGAAAMIIAGCAKETVTRVADNRAIQFDTHIDNTTKAVTEVSGKLTDTDYFIFGNAGTDGINYAEQLFNNEDATAVYYWAASQYYIFGAYADGAKGKLTTTDQVAFDAATGKLTFKNYTVSDDKDLIAVVAKTQTTADLTNPADVVLTFKHMLSQVKFSVTTAETGFTIKVNNFKILNLPTQGTTGTIDAAGAINWTPAVATGNLDYVATEQTVTASPVSTECKMVLPQGNTNNLTVKFDASISGKGLNATKTLTASLTYSGQDPTTANTWVPGYRYNYTATLTQAHIVDAKPIKFTAEVEAWKDATAQDATQTLK